MRRNVNNVRCVWVAFVCCCFACDCVLELVCRAMVSGPVRACVLSVVRLRFGRRTSQPSKPKDTPARPRDATAETAADSTAAGPEPTAPASSYRQLAYLVLLVKIYRIRIDCQDSRQV